MRVLLDECVDRRLSRDIDGHEVRTVPQMGWVSIRNGDLLSRADAEFDVFVTTDRNLSFQQNLPRFKMAVIVLRARSNRLADLQPLIPGLLEVIDTAPRGQATVLGNP